MEDQGVFNSLRTDPTGDRLGNNCMAVENKVPVSKTGIAPRAGTSLYSHYEMTQAGRQVFTDGLLDALGNGVGVFCVSRASLDDDTIARAFYAHYPGAVSSDYNSITGSCSGVATFTSANWTEVSSNPAFPSGLITTFLCDGGDGFLYTLVYVPGNPNSTNSVWRSADGITWFQRNSGTAFGNHYKAGALLLMGGALYTYGGSHNGTGGKTFKSTDGAATWTQTETHAIDTSWGDLTLFGSCVFDSKLWITGGVESHAAISDTYTSSVWSSPDGVTWSLVTASAGWGTVGVGGGRSGMGLCTTGSTMIVVAGILFGTPQTDVSDVWSSTDGVVWTQINAGGDFSPRAGVSYSSPNGTPMIYGGSDLSPTLFDDLWISLDAGVTWQQAFAAVTGVPRVVAAMAYFNDAMWISCGLISTSSFITAHDVWTTPISVSCIFP